MRADTTKLYKDAYSLLNSCIESKKEQFAEEQCITEVQVLYYLFYCILFIQFSSPGQTQEIASASFQEINVDKVFEECTISIDSKNPISVEGYIDHVHNHLIEINTEKNNRLIQSALLRQIQNQVL